FRARRFLRPQPPCLYFVAMHAVESAAKFLGRAVVLVRAPGMIGRSGIFAPFIRLVRCARLPLAWRRLSMPAHTRCGEIVEPHQFCSELVTQHAGRYFFDRAFGELAELEGAE